MQTQPTQTPTGARSRSKLTGLLGGRAGGGDARPVGNAPYLRAESNVRRVFQAHALATLPALLGAIYFFGWQVLLTPLVAGLAGGLTLWAFSRLRRGVFFDGLVVTALLLTLLLPPGFPLWLVALGAIAAFGVRELLGGLGVSPFQPALVGYALLALLFPGAFTAHWAEPIAGGFSAWAPPPESLGALTPLTALRQGQGQEASLGQLLWGGVPGPVGNAAGWLLLLGGLYLLLRGAIDWRIPVGMVLTLWIGQSLLAMTLPEWFQGSWLLHLLTGSFLLGAFWLAADPAASPMTPRGKWLFAIGAALLIVLLRGLAPHPEAAVAFGILAMNVLVPWLDRVTIPRSFGGGGRSP